MQEKTLLLSTVLILLLSFFSYTGSDFTGKHFADTKSVYSVPSYAEKGGRAHSYDVDGDGDLDHNDLQNIKHSIDGTGSKDWVRFADVNDDGFVSQEDLDLASAAYQEQLDARVNAPGRANECDYEGQILCFPGRAGYVAVNAGKLGPYNICEIDLVNRQLKWSTEIYYCSDTYTDKVTCSIKASRNPITNIDESVHSCVETFRG